MLQTKFTYLHNCFVLWSSILKAILKNMIYANYPPPHQKKSRLAIQRLEVMKNDLQIRIAKEVRKRRVHVHQFLIYVNLAT
jgi:hypothetical protein